MSVSNYQYHAREEVPLKEQWVKWQNPCQVRYGNDGSGAHFADYVLPALNETDVFPIVKRPVTRSDFANVANDCRSLFQAKDDLKNANFHEHLMALNPNEGLRLATAELIIQGFQNGGDILRMANNIVRLKQAENVVKYSAYYKQMEKYLSVYTLSLDNFIAEPAKSFNNFLDFLFEGMNVSQKRKEKVAFKYEEYFYKKSAESPHVTWGKSSNRLEQNNYLRNDPIYGPPLRKIEFLVDAALDETREKNTNIGANLTAR
mmetsp:Transcript_19484/g.39707  ORF Transcript_19484/g.39707 Transcript_19484/m.39707 type:complete len:260 (+) Transcript_19484:68-847(+)